MLIMQNSENKLLKNKRDNLPQEFYDELASVYHLIFENWDVSMQEQGEIIARLIPPAQQGPILDCACGIGTQILPLATLGYKVEGIDLSELAIKRAKKEASIRGLTINFRQDDMRKLSTVPLNHYETVIALDNALPHLESDKEIVVALKAMKERLKNGGCLLLSLRDYAQLVKERPTFTPPKFFQDGKYRRIVHQIWDWLDNEHYIVHLYITYENPSGWQAHHFVGKYRAITIDQVVSIMKDIGFVKIELLSSDTTRFYQPIIRGLKL